MYDLGGGYDVIVLIQSNDDELVACALLHLLAGDLLKIDLRLRGGLEAFHLVLLAALVAVDDVFDSAGRLCVLDFDRLLRLLDGFHLERHQL